MAQTNSDRSSQHPKTDEQVSETPKSLIWQDFDAAVSKLQGTVDPVSSATIEIDKYLAETILSRSKDPLEWWEMRKLIYPKLYAIMVKRLCIPATSVPCERIFQRQVRFDQNDEAGFVPKTFPKFYFSIINNL